MRLYLRALAYFWPERFKVFALLVLIGLGAMAALLQVWPMMVLIDSVMTNTPKVDDWLHRSVLRLLPDDRVGQAIGLAGMTLVLRLTQEALGRGRTLLNLNIGYGGLMRIRCDLYRKLQALSLDYHRAQPQGDAVYRLSSDTLGCQAILNTAIELIVAVVMLLIMTVIMLSRNVQLTFVALSITPFLFLANIAFGRTFRSRTTAAKEVDCEFTSTVQRSLVAIGLVQAFGREPDEYARFHKTVSNSIRAWLALHWQEVCYGMTVSVIFGVGSALVFGYGGYLVYLEQFGLGSTAATMSIGDLMLFMSYLGMLYDPLCKISGAGASIQGGAAGVQRVFEVLDRDPVIVDRPDAVALSQTPRKLILNDVGFEYLRGHAILQNVNVEIQPGEMVAFVGSSGVGKSTLLNLLPRFYDATNGSIRLDDLDVRDVRLRDLRKHIALVLQESIILPTTIAENISYGRPHATDEEIHAAAMMAGAHSFIEKLPQGYHTKLVDSGHNLSGGQRQRIAIARALLTFAPIIVLDEPTSALDPQHERLVTETLHSLKGVRTMIIVSHRLSTVVHCDQIFVMDGGTIVERGTHEQLLQQRGLYHAMAQHQLQLEVDDAQLLAAA